MGLFYQPLYLAGQTGSGKTGVSLALAHRIGQAEIINADAFQIYSGIEILSAAPSIEEQDGIPHHLFGTLSIGSSCDAASFARQARQTINEVATRSVPIVVGGSGLYLKSITHGLAPTPPGDPELRGELEQKSLDDLVEQYRNLDPSGAAKTNLRNRRYVTRNLEICLLTGEPASVLKDRWERESPDVRGIYLQRSRDDIYDRINRRTHLMFEQGVVAQIRALSESPSPTAAKAIGWLEIRQLIEGEIAEDDCIARIQQITRKYAKRQETWFKKEQSFRKIACYPEDNADNIVDRILETYPLSEIGMQSKEEPCPPSPQETRPEYR